MPYIIFFKSYYTYLCSCGNHYTNLFCVVDTLISLSNSFNTDSIKMLMYTPGTQPKRYIQVYYIGEFISRQPYKKFKKYLLYPPIWLPIFSKCVIEEYDDKPEVKKCL